MGMLKSFATKHHLTTISQLKPFGPFDQARRSARVRHPLRGSDRVEAGLWHNPTFKPLAIGLTYKALDTGQVQVSDVFTTDPQLTTGKYTTLSDPKNIFGFQNVAPIVKTSVLKQEGPAFAQTINAVSKLLTLSAIRQMNAAVALNQENPATVAHKFLAANGLA